VANYLLGKLPLVYGRRAMLGLAALPSAVLSVSLLAMLESPRWLVMQGRVVVGKKAPSLWPQARAEGASQASSEEGAREAGQLAGGATRVDGREREEEDRGMLDLGT
jgi:hypothetical protein